MWKIINMLVEVFKMFLEVVGLKLIVLLWVIFEFNDDNIEIY